MEDRWIECSLSISELNRKKIKASACIGPRTVIDGIAEVFARANPEGMKKIDVQFLALDAPSHRKFMRFCLTELQAKNIRKTPGEGYDLTYEGIINSS